MYSLPHQNVQRLQSSEKETNSKRGQGSSIVDVCEMGKKGLKGISVEGIISDIGQF